MAGHLADAGYEVTVYNRSNAPRARWLAAHTGRAAATPSEAADGADFVLACTGNDDDLRAITLGSGGAFETLGAGALFIDHTTASAEIARELAAAAAARGAAMLDAPISGGQSGAENGQLTVMLGGEERDYARAIPLLDCYAAKHALLGPAGAGQLTKMVNQICIAGLLQGLSEGLHFATRAGLEIDRVVSVLSKGAAQSWQMDHRASTMARGEFDFGFAVEWMRKDLAIALDEARRNGAELPVAELVDRFYAEIAAAGGARLDTSSLITRLGAER
jgi:3-hydroxyisobutyrate dehydrogenase-like beta-hydroxyacid dehydrogenase